VPGSDVEEVMLGAMVWVREVLFSNEGRVAEFVLREKVADSRLEGL
jgi:hypothetical protein